MAVTVDVRCPQPQVWGGQLRPGRLFARLKVEEWQVIEGNLIEIACRDCSTRGKRVLHRFTMLGEHVETVHG